MLEARWQVKRSVDTGEKMDKRHFTYSYWCFSQHKFQESAMMVFCGFNIVVICKASTTHDQRWVNTLSLILYLRMQDIRGYSSSTAECYISTGNSLSLRVMKVTVAAAGRYFVAAGVSFAACAVSWQELNISQRTSIDCQCSVCTMHSPVISVSIKTK